MEITLTQDEITAIKMAYNHIIMNYKGEALDECAWRLHLIIEKTKAATTTEGDAK